MSDPAETLMETLGAGAIVDVWTGGSLEWRSRLEESEFLESADWQMALQLSRAVIAATKKGGGQGNRTLSARGL